MQGLKLTFAAVMMPKSQTAVQTHNTDTRGRDLCCKGKSQQACLTAQQRCCNKAAHTQGHDLGCVSESQQPCACLPALLQQGSTMPLLCWALLHKDCTACTAVPGQCQIQPLEVPEMSWQAAHCGDLDFEARPGCTTKRISS